MAGAESDESSQKIQASTFEINMDNTRDVMYNLINVINIAVFMHWRRKQQPTPVFLPGESQGWGSLGELPSMGSHRVGHN